MNHPRIKSSIVVILASSVLPPLLFVASRASALPARQPAAVKGPIIQAVGLNSATISWITQANVQRSHAENVDKPDAVQLPVYSRMDVTGLEPGRRYNFDLSAGGLDARVSFKTAAREDDPFMFIAYGDTRTRHDVHKKIADKILAEQPDFVLHVGDLVANGLKDEDWDTFFDISRDLLRRVPFFPVLGNHERNAPVYFKYFVFPNGNGHYYSFDWGNAHFVAINSNEVGRNSEEKESFFQHQMDWLREDLRRNRKALTFAFFHHPLFSAVERRKKAAARLAQRIEPVLLEGGVAVAFSGHDHNYQHHVHAGIHYVVTGGGGAPLYDVSPTPETAVHAEKADNYVRVSVAKDVARLEALDPDGNLLESFEVKGVPRETAKETTGGRK